MPSSSDGPSAVSRSDHPRPAAPLARERQVAKRGVVAPPQENQQPPAGVEGGVHHGVRPQCLGLLPARSRLVADELRSGGRSRVPPRQDAAGGVDPRGGGPGRAPREARVLGQAGREVDAASEPLGDAVEARDGAVVEERPRDDRDAPVAPHRRGTEASKVRRNDAEERRPALTRGEERLQGARRPPRHDGVARRVHVQVQDGGAARPALAAQHAPPAPTGSRIEVGDDQAERRVLLLDPGGDPVAPIVELDLERHHRGGG